MADHPRPCRAPGAGIKGAGQPVGGSESAASRSGAPSQAALPAFPWLPGLKSPLCVMGHHCPPCLSLSAHPHCTSRPETIPATTPLLLMRPQCAPSPSSAPLSWSDPLAHLLPAPHRRDPAPGYHGKGTCGLPREHRAAPSPGHSCTVPCTLRHTRMEPLTGRGVQLRKQPLSRKGPAQGHLTAPGTGAGCVGS